MLTPDERVRIRYHAGYPNSQNVSTSVLGIPSTIESLFLIENAMNNIRPEAEYQVRRILQILDGIESQMVDDLDVLVANQVGSIIINPQEQAKLIVAYDRWVDALCTTLAIERNPYDMRLQQSGLNIGVRN